MTAPDFGIFDCDNHYYEPRDTFRHLDPSMADRAVKIVTDESGKDAIFVGGQKHHFTPPTFDLVPPPGQLKIGICRPMRMGVPPDSILPRSGTVRG